MTRKTNKPKANMPQDWEKACLTIFERLRYRHSIHTVFSDFVEMSAFAISNQSDLRQAADREARYLQIAGKYSKDELKDFSELLGCVCMALSERYSDVLGRLFMALSLGNNFAGQFFTPYSVCTLMAQVTLTGIGETIARKGFATLYEPASGAGAMLIACAEAVREMGHDPRECLHVTAQDLDLTAVHMTYLQLSILGIPAVVIQGNALTDERRSVWFTPAHIAGRWSRRLEHQLDMERQLGRQQAA